MKILKPRLDRCLEWSFPRNWVNCSHHNQITGRTFILYRSPSLSQRVLEIEDTIDSLVQINL